MVPTRYFVVKHGNQWRIEFDDAYQNGFVTKKEALKAARQFARDTAGSGKEVEVLVQSENGMWFTDWTDKDI